MYIQEQDNKQNDVVNCNAGMVEQEEQPSVCAQHRLRFPNHLHTFHYTPGGTFLFISINVHRYVEKYISYKKDKSILYFEGDVHEKGRQRMCYSGVTNSRIYL